MADNTGCNGADSSDDHTREDSSGRMEADGLGQDHTFEKPSSQKQPLVYDDGADTWFWRTHTVTALAIIVCGLVYTTFLEETPQDTMLNMRRGAIAVVIFFLLIGTIHMPSGPFIRPHPVVWRLVLSVMILYVLTLIFALFQTIDDTRQFLKLYDPSLGQPLPERTYAEDCRIYTPDHPNGSFANVADKMDVFVPSHFFGWYVKGLILRDMWILHMLSAGFEFFEYTLECQLPNFGECWWDHWILDFLLCNGLGIYLGAKTCQYLSMRSYHWRSLWKIPSLKGKLKRAVGQFTPYSWTEYKWGYSESFMRYGYICMMTSFWMLQELNTFYLKAILWIPPNHSLNFYREMLYAFVGACATKESYDYLRSTDKNASIGRHTWLVFTGIICEMLLEIKFGWETLSIRPPTHMLVFWGVLALVFVCWSVWRFVLPLLRALHRRQHSSKKIQ